MVGLNCTYIRTYTSVLSTKNILVLTNQVRNIHRHYIGCKSTLLFRLLGSFFVILISLATSSCDVRVYVLCLGSGPPCRQTDRQTDDQRGAAKVEACVSHCAPARLSVHLR